ncbi:uncharacterized protein LOC124533777 [Vanessa cardui]|uniref:uncharacterized protein LOC124533777 n=1 Tax=Vanessa cardui TaxID=171605 RepID=UPI001F12D553|nr:uncharacterized protein LOC124533777 [Vanessa cardui]
MYIAFKYLFGMAVTMWVLLCCLDLYWKKSMEKHFDNDFQKLLLPFYENTSIVQENLIEPKNEINISTDNMNNNIYLQFFMYFVGVCMVFIINRKHEIITLTKGRFNYINYDTAEAYLRLKCMYLKKTAKTIRDTIIMFLKNMYSRIKVNKVRDVNFNLILLNKLKELNQKHRNLSDILIPTIQENKNLRMQFYLKSVCNDENIVCNVFSQKTIMENRSVNVGFQKLYLMTHRENVFLRSRLKNITQEKEDAERKLIKLVNRVCQSKNNDLKAYCSQFIVQTTNNLLNSDVKAEIQKFLEKSSDDAYFPVNRLSEQMNSLKLTELINSENPIIAKECAPKLKSALETQVQNYVWTVKDKDGIIEKLYEYQSDSQNGTIIRRIRQYSVYYDTERVVDLSNSTTLIDHQKADVSNLLCVTNQRFLSGSQAFKNFLQNNKSIVLKQSRSPKSTICIAT